MALAPPGFHQGPENSARDAYAPAQSTSIERTPDHEVKIKEQEEREEQQQEDTPPAPFTVPDLILPEDANHGLSASIHALRDVARRPIEQPTTNQGLSASIHAPRYVSRTPREQPATNQGLSASIHAPRHVVTESTEQPAAPDSLEDVSRGLSASIHAPRHRVREPREPAASDLLEDNSQGLSASIHAPRHVARTPGEPIVSDRAHPTDSRQGLSASIHAPRHVASAPRQQFSTNQGLSSSIHAPRHTPRTPREQPAEPGLVLPEDASQGLSASIHAPGYVAREERVLITPSSSTLNAPSFLITPNSRPNMPLDMAEMSLGGSSSFERDLLAYAPAQSSLVEYAESSRNTRNSVASEQRNRDKGRASGRGGFKGKEKDQNKDSSAYSPMPATDDKQINNKKKSHKPRGLKGKGKEKAKQEEDEFASSLKSMTIDTPGTSATSDYKPTQSRGRASGGRGLEDGKDDQERNGSISLPEPSMRREPAPLNVPSVMPIAPGSISQNGGLSASIHAPRSPEVNALPDSEQRLSSAQPRPGPAAIDIPTLFDIVVSTSGNRSIHASIHTPIPEVLPTSPPAPQKQVEEEEELDSRHATSLASDQQDLPQTSMSGIYESIHAPSRRVGNGTSSTRQGAQAIAGRRRSPPSSSLHHEATSVSPTNGSSTPSTPTKVKKPRGRKNKHENRQSGQHHRGAGRQRDVIPPGRPQIRSEHS
ncbi:hypothetical protein CPB84DRAFT_829214 [Gymnopilus junonius]|uniref:Uncharacterized protein n=1 Tax=Gymnopilus junonius TaxID=109634 RepID=A0A9P5TFE4_GYMJU|nr:hypothetical protein CPB84DRAFT_829214 [Gymnopilus junonius]